MATREEAQAQARVSEEYAHCSAMVLQALVYPKEHVVKRFKNRKRYGDFGAIVVDPLSPTGGYVGVLFNPKGQRGSVACQYVPYWTGQMLKAWRLNNGDEARLRQLAMDVQDWCRGFQAAQEGA